MMSGSNRSPFTASQWEELEHQALIFKYMISNIPVPFHLRFPFRRSCLESSPAPKIFPCKSPHGNHDVFLCFKDRLYALALYGDLERKSIKTFMHDGRGEGEEITQELKQVIQKSKIAVIVFTAVFASSTFCLDQVAKIIECHETFGQIVVPIFLHISRSQVKNQTGSFEEDFARHAVNDPERVETWKAALSKAANMPGWDQTDTWTNLDTITQDIKEMLISETSYLDGQGNEELCTLFFSLILEVSSAISEQLNRALTAMILAIIGYLFCIGCLVRKARKEKVRWEQKGLLPWFYSRYPEHKPFGTTMDFFQVFAAIWQCFHSTLGYCIARLLHKPNPINMNVTMFLLCLCFVISILIKKYSRPPPPRTHVV